MTQNDMEALADMVARRLFALLRERSPLEAQALAAEALGADTVSRLALADFLEESGAQGQAERLRTMLPLRQGEVLILKLPSHTSNEVRRQAERDLQDRIKDRLGVDVMVLAVHQDVDLERLRLHGEKAPEIAGGAPDEEGGGGS
jgi:hypothetical protein